MSVAATSKAKLTVLARSGRALLMAALAGAGDFERAHGHAVEIDWRRCRNTAR